MPFINDRLKFIEKEPETIQVQREEADHQRRSMSKRIPSRYKFDCEVVMKCLRERIFGQDQVMEVLENMLKIVKADISDVERPLFVGLFLGPTGVGKTEIVKVLAEAIHGNRNHFCRVDMNTLSLEHYAAALTGAPPGYVGSKEGSSLLKKEVIEGTYSKPGIVLFDELEKANHQVIQTLLNVLDNGILESSSGNETISFRNTIIIMTSNIGAKDVYKLLDKKTSFLWERILHNMKPSNSISLLDKIVHRNLEQKLEPEFINRIDDIVVFKRMDKDIMDPMIEKFIDQLSVKLKKYNCSVQLEQSAKEYIKMKSFDERFGGRAIRRLLRTHIEVPLAEILIDKPDGNRFVTYKGTKDLDSDKLNFKAYYID